MLDRILKEIKIQIQTVFSKKKKFRPYFEKKTNSGSISNEKKIHSHFRKKYFYKGSIFKRAVF